MSLCMCWVSWLGVCWAGGWQSSTWTAEAAYYSQVVQTLNCHVSPCVEVWLRCVWLVGCMLEVCQVAPKLCIPLTVLSVSYLLG